MIEHCKSDVPDAQNPDAIRAKIDSGQNQRMDKQEWTSKIDRNRKMKDRSESENEGWVKEEKRGKGLLENG